MSEFIAEQRRSIKARLREVEEQLKGWDDLHAEKERLEAALAALGEASNGPAPRTSKTAKLPAPKRARRKGKSKRASGIGERIVGYVTERSGVTVDGIAQALGEDKKVVYRNAYSLATRGKLERVKLPGGKTGFKVPS